MTVVPPPSREGPALNTPFHAGELSATGKTGMHT